MTKSEQAIRLIIQEGITAAEAADRVGISRAAVSKAKLHPSKTSQNIRKLCEMHGEIEKLTAQRNTLLAALRYLTEAILTNADADYVKRQMDEAVRVLDLHGVSMPVPYKAISSVKGGAA